MNLHGKLLQLEVSFPYTNLSNSPTSYLEGTVSVTNDNDYVIISCNMAHTGSHRVSCFGLMLHNYPGNRHLTVRLRSEYPGTASGVAIIQVTLLHY